MRQLEYDNDEFTIRLEFPHGWNVDVIDSVEIKITDLSGSELLADTAADLIDDTTLGAAASERADTVVLNTDTSPESGDRLYIAASAAGPAEEIVVENYDSATKTITLKYELLYAHSSGAGVYGLYGTYDADLSDTDVFLLGKQVVLTWTPLDSGDASAGLPLKERAEVALFQLGIQGLQERFRSLYPREYEAISEPYSRFDSFVDEARKQLQIDLNLEGLNIDRVPNSELLIPCYMAKMRWLVLLSGDDRYETERKVAMNEYNTQIERLKLQPIWQDDNQDEAKSDDEFEDHSQYVGLERGL